MMPTLDEAVRVVFGPPSDGRAPSQPAGAVSGAVGTARPAALPEARAALTRASDALKDGDWETFGAAMERLEAILAPSDAERRETQSP